MPSEAPRACSAPGCPGLVTRATPCPQHPRVWPEGRGSTRAWRMQRRQVLEQHAYLCVACRAEGRERYAVDVDHVMPVHQGGRDDAANLQPLCRQHHKTKSATEHAHHRAKTAADRAR